MMTIEDHWHGNRWDYLDLEGDIRTYIGLELYAMIQG